MDNLRITIVQCKLNWELIDDNLTDLTLLLSPIRKGSTDLIVLPEMFSTGFTMRAAALAEPPGGYTQHWMQKLAKTKQAVVCGSFITVEKSKFYNRFYWVEPDGKVFTYDKRHLFSIGNEHNHYTAGSKQLVVQLKGWRIMPMICYDLRFPVWSRQSALRSDLLIYIASWPAIRRLAWTTLAKARAIENVCFVAAVNRIGTDGNGVKHVGDSMVVNYLGEVISKTKPRSVSVETVTLLANELLKFRKNFPVLDDADSFSLKF